jgi:alkylation response protein AidB-like acyl-CoA dehydrogenase
MPLETFRRETRQWLAQNCPPEMRKPSRGEPDICWGGRNWEFQSEDQKIWLERMAARGWTVPMWPKEYGGGGLSREEEKILREEMRAISARSPLESFGIWMLGPALLQFGSEAQKLEHLPKIARGEIRWCQGYSEPGAGSDLASLQTKAEDKGDHFLVNGQKIWTSYADKADWIFCLVRTDPSAPKHKGISFVLFDMTTPGVTTKPILLISGKSPFCETFFDNVKVSKANLVGTLNDGWTIAKYLLTHERASIGGGLAIAGMRSLPAEAIKAIGRDGSGRLADPFVREEVIRAEIDGRALLATIERYKAEAKAGQGVGAKSAILKYAGTELNKRRYEAFMTIGGSDALEWESERSEEGTLAREWLRIVAKRILDLPEA